MAGIEQRINEMLRGNPKFKKAVKRVYQRSMYCLHSKIKAEGDLCRISGAGEETFFGYYDKSPWNADGRYMLGVRVKDASREAAPKEPCEILLFDTENNYSYKVIAVSHTWNVQQGCMLQWMGPDFKDKVLYNDFIGGKYVSVVMDIYSGERKTYGVPVYAVDSQGRYALSLDFSRLHRMRPGYGYSNLPDKSSGQLCPDSVCISRLDLSTGEIQPLLEYTDLVKIAPRKEMKGAEHKVNHIMVNPSGTRFMVLHRWIKNGKKYTRLITMNMDASEPYVLCDDDMVSHCFWKNDTEILAWARKRETGDAYYLLKDRTRNYEMKWRECLQTDGHPSYSPNGRFVVTDCYPNRIRMASVFLNDTCSDKTYTLAKVFSPFKYDNDTRCDLHPRWNREGTEICIDSVHEGYRGMYVIPLKKNKIKILYVVSTLRDTGPTNQLYGIIRNLDKELFEPSILTLSKEPKDSKIQLFLEAQIPVRTLGLGRKEFILKGKKVLNNEIQKLAPDIIHTSGIRPDNAISGLKGNLLHCASIRNYVFEDYVPKFGKVKGMVMARIHCRAIKKIKYPICCSNTLKAMYQAFLKKKVYSIQNGVDTERYSDCSVQERQLLREKYGIGAEKIVFVVVGSLIARKDPLTILKAFHESEKKQDCVLLVLGSGELEAECKQFEDPDIRLLGHVSNVNDYLKLADGYISAALSEGLPNTVLEAGACGLPMILSDIPQHREIFKKSLDGVMFFNVQDTDCLQQKINEMAMNIKNTDREQIKNYISENFASEKMSEKYQRLYCSMLKGQKNVI